MSEILEAVEVVTHVTPKAAVIWLHGLGADGHDFEPILPALRLGEEAAIRFVFPHAPMRPVTINMGMRMRAWYDIIGLDRLSPEDEPGIRSSVISVTKLIEREEKRGIPPENVVLAGFSQGGALALFAGLRHPRRLAGILALSAYLPLPDQLAGDAAEANCEVPILQCHGAWDPLVPVGLGEGTRDALREVGYHVEWRTYPTEHSVHPREIEDVGKWLRELLVGR